MSLSTTDSPEPETGGGPPNEPIAASDAQYPGGPYCYNCGILLKIGDNWAQSKAKKGKKQCKDCSKKYSREYYAKYTSTRVPKKSRDVMRAEAKQRLIRRLRDEDRVLILTDRIRDFNLQYGRELFVRSQMDTIERGVKSASKELTVAEWEEAKRDVEERAKTLSYERLPKQPEDFVIAKILLTYRIIDPVEGDTKATWHIAFHNAGYNAQYQLDSDGLPLARPGVSRLNIITYVIKKADHRFAKRRIGITMAVCKEARRGNRPERRVVLCKTDVVFNQKSQEHAQRIDGMNRSLAQLKDSMNVPIDQTRSVVDIFTDAYYRNR